MAPASAPDPSPLPFLQSINSLWGLISGAVLGLWVSFRTIWNISRYFRGVDDRFDKLEREIALLHQLILEVRRGLYVDEHDVL